MRNFVENNTNELVINVIGFSASGKSSIMLMIEKMLVDNGFNVEINHVDEEPLRYKNLETKLKSILDKNDKIIINEVQAVKTLKNEIS